MEEEVVTDIDSPGVLDRIVSKVIPTSTACPDLDHSKSIVTI